jgi:uncharacterized protein YybS (DUF2232 family)
MVEGALFSAIFIIVLVISAYIPPVGAIGVYLLPLPITVYAYRNTFGYSLIVVIVTTILALMLAPPIAIINAIMASTIGAFYGTVIRKKYSETICFLTLIIISSIEFILLELLAKTAFGQPIIATFALELEKMIHFAANNLGGYFETLLQSDIVDLIISNLSIGIISIMGLLNAFIVFSVTAIFFKKLNYEMIYLPFFAKNSESRYLALFYTASMALMLFAIEQVSAYPIIAGLLVNVLLLLSVYYWIKGYMMFCELLSRVKISKIFQVIICLTSFFLLPFIMIFIAIYFSLKPIKKR